MDGSIEKVLYRLKESKKHQKHAEKQAALWANELTQCRQTCSAIEAEFNNLFERWDETTDNFEDLEVKK